MKILLDTNAFLLQLGILGGRTLGAKTRMSLETADAVYVSAITVVELHIKALLGKLEAPEDWTVAIVQAGDIPLPFSTEAGDQLRRIKGLARHDPFDRMLIAQAQAEGMHMLTTDGALLELGLPFVIDARK